MGQQNSMGATYLGVVNAALWDAVLTLRDPDLIVKGTTLVTLKIKT